MKVHIPVEDHTLPLIGRILERQRLTNRCEDHKFRPIVKRMDGGFEISFCCSLLRDDLLAELGECDIPRPSEANDPDRSTRSA